MAEKWEKILEEAGLRLLNGDIDGAIRLCDEVINLPENAIPKKIRAAAFVIRGNTHQKKGDFDRAISNFNEAIKLESKHAVPLINRGNAYQEKGDFDRAISDYDEAIKLDFKLGFKNADAFNNRGNAYQEKGDFDRAISDYDEAIKLGFKLDSKNAVVFYNRGKAYHEKGDLDRAISDYDKAIKLEPNLTGAFHNRALVYGRLNAQADEKKYREGYEQEMQKLREELRKVSDPGEVIETYKKRENEYKAQIKALGDEIKTFADELRNRLTGGFAGIALIVGLILIFGDSPLGFAHGFALTSLMLAWLAVNYPASIRLSDMRKEKRKMEICAEDYFRKLTLARYTLASEGDERQKMMAVTHAHFATRSAAEFLADWNPASDDKSNPLFDSIEKIVRRKDDDSPPKPPETKS